MKPNGIILILKILLINSYIELKVKTFKLTPTTHENLTPNNTNTNNKEIHKTN